LNAFPRQGRAELLGVGDDAADGIPRRREQGQAALDGPGLLGDRRRRLAVDAAGLDSVRQRPGEH
jgi:hypothetical protein